MPATVYYAAASLDGYIAEPEETLGWLMGYDGTYDGEDAVPMKGEYDRFYEGVGAVAMGSKTYEFVLDQGKWLYAGRPGWVFTRRELPLAEGADESELRFVAGDVAELHSEMLGSAGDRDLWVVGGGDLASQLTAADLLDELIVTVVPVVLGDGLPLFAGAVDGPLQLTGTRAFDNGMVELRYALGRPG